MNEYKSIRKGLENSINKKNTEEALKYLAELDIFVERNAEELTIHAKEEQVLKESEEMYRVLAENSNDFIALHDINGIFLYTSPAVTEMLGYEPNELVGLNPYNFFHQDDIQRLANNQKKLLEKGTTTSIQFRYKHKNGQFIWLESTLKTLYNHNGEPFRIIASNRNIQERKEAEFALHKSEEKYRFLTENILDVIWILDAETFNCTYISPSIEKLRGYTPEEVISHPVENSLTENSLIYVQKAFPFRKNLFEENPSQSEIYFDELEQPCKNGSTIWVEVITYFRKNPDTQKLEIIGTSRDITERRNSQIALKQVRERLKVLTDITIEGIMILENGIIIDVNPSLEKILKIDNDQIIGNNFLKYVHPDYYPQVESLLLSDIKSRFEIIVKRSDKSLLPVEIETNTISIGNKTLRVAAIRDITDRKKSEEQINKLTAAISQSPAAIVITDTKGAIEYINPHFTKITGYTFEEAIGKNPRVLKSGKIPDELYKELWDTITSGNIWKGELLNKKKDGSLFWEIATIAPIKNDKGKTINYVAVKEDITQRKEAENAFILTKQKLEEANATKDKFFSIIAHDLKNPFNIILGFSDLLLQNHKEYDIETRESVIKTIYEISLKTFNLLENLLAWSRSKAGNITHNPKIFDIKLIAYDSIGLFNEAAEKKNIKIYLDTTDDYSIFADRDMVAAVLRNLINNGIKFTKKNGKISIFINKVNNKFIEISVKDSGIGIRQEKLDILFNIDRDWNTPGTEDEAGTGLGLILCKEFVEKNGGTIHVESQVGIGTTFTFTVPLAE